MKEQAPRSKSKKAIVRKYLMQQCALKSPATYDHFLISQLGSKISRRDFNFCVQSLKLEFLNDDTSRHWWEVERHSAAILAPEKIEEYYPKGIEVEISNNNFNNITYEIKEAIANDPVRFKWFQERRQNGIFK